MNANLATPRRSTPTRDMVPDVRRGLLLLLLLLSIEIRSRNVGAMLWRRSAPRLVSFVENFAAQAHTMVHAAPRLTHLDSTRLNR